MSRGESPDAYIAVISGELPLDLASWLDLPRCRSGLRAYSGAWLLPRPGDRMPSAAESPGDSITLDLRMAKVRTLPGAATCATSPPHPVRRAGQADLLISVDPTLLRQINSRLEPGAHHLADMCRGSVD